VLDPRLVLTLAAGVLLLLNGLTAGRPQTTPTAAPGADDVDRPEARPDA
jgi:hypothetical protein